MFTRYARRYARRHARRLTILTPLVALLLTPLAAHAQPLADRLPADAAVYVGWQGSQGLGNAYKESRLKAVLDATDASQLIDDFFPKLVALAEKEDKHAGDAVRLFTSLAKPMWEHPTAFAFGGIDWNAQPDPMPQ